LSSIEHHLPPCGSLAGIVSDAVVRAVAIFT